MSALDHFEVTEFPAQPSGTSGEDPAASVGRLLESIDRARYDAANPPPPVEPVFMLAGCVIGTRGNLVVVASQAKGGKTAFVGAMIAATAGRDGDTLGVSSANPHGRAVIHFDTEQSPRDFHDVVSTAFRRVDCVAPSWFRGFSVLDLSIADRFAALEAEAQRARTICGAIHSIFVDGIADLLHDPNDAAEAFAFVARLHALAARMDCVIVCVLHFNPGSESGKTRGHLGSQLERKAETTLALDKDADGVTTVYSTKARHTMLAKVDGPRFRWSDAQRMHVAVEAARKEHDAERMDTLREQAADVFNGHDTLRYGELIAAIKTTARVKDRAAEKRIAEMRKHRIIERRFAGAWRLARSE